MFNKIVMDPLTDLTLFTATWETQSFGTISSDAAFILQDLSERLDLFVLEYVRVNEDAC